MPAVVANNDHVIPRSTLGTTLAVSALLAQPPLEGIVTDVTANAAKVLWSSGLLVTGLDVTDGTVSPLLRVAAPTSGSLSAFAGRVVGLTGGSTEFVGPVVQVLSIELDPAGAPGTFTDCLVVKSRGPSQAYWVAPVSSVTIVE